MVFAVLAFVMLAAGPAFATKKKVALVVGNAAYQHTAALRNPLNDAEDVAGMLASMGFEVVLGIDLTRPAFRTILSEFAKRLEGADRAVFYYSGHALQVEGRNYLVPTDARLSGELGLDFELVGLDLIQRALERQVDANVIFLDACRDNPLGRNLARDMGSRSTRIAQGLAPAESGVGTLISFSTQPGNIAVDGEGRNSPFTAALLKHAKNKSEDVSTLLIKVRKDVMAATGNKQVPWEHSALRERFFLNEIGAGAGQIEENRQTFGEEGEGEFWSLVQASNDASFYREYLSMFPDGAHAQTARKRLAALTGVPGTGAASESAKPPVTLSRRELASRAQKLLQGAGCYTGRIDGIWGPKSRYALRKALGARVASNKLDPVILLRLEGLVPGHCVPEAKSRQATPDAVAKPQRNARRTPQRSRTTKSRREKQRSTRRQATRRPQSQPGPSRASRERRNAISEACRAWQRCTGSSTRWRVNSDCPNRPPRCQSWIH
jgi:hypothetical protein